MKIGWSKIQKSEYEHKAPFTVIHDLTAAILHTASKTRRFVMDTILPLKSSVDGQEVPSYQTYACLARLRREGLIIQHGRQGYSIKPKAEINAIIQKLFKQLPEQQVLTDHA